MNAQQPVSVVRLGVERFDEAVAVVCSAFRDYPVMRYLIGDAGDDYDRRLRLLIGSFNSHRFARGYPVLGVVRGERIVAVASLNAPVEVPLPPEIIEERRVLWNDLGEDTHARLAAFVEATEAFNIVEPHLHLGMLAAHRDEQDRGNGRRLLEAVHALSASDPQSSGVSLTTEVRANVGFYEHFGYRIVGETDVGGLHSWGFYRPNS